MDTRQSVEGTAGARTGRGSRRLTRLVMILVLAVVPVLSASAGAQASTTKTVSFGRSWVFKSRPLHVCVYFTLHGKITYSTTTNGRGVVFWRNQRLSGPTLEADIHAYGGGSCIGPSTVTRIRIGQYWTGYSCRFNPSLSVSLPWGVSFGGWPSCGNRTRAAHASSYGAAAFYVQYNSGSPTRFGAYNGSPQNPPCYGIFVAATAGQRNISDSFTSNPRKVCLPAR